MVKRKREELSRVFSLPNCEWGPWYTALVPKAPNNSRRYKPRKKDNKGFIYTPIKERFDEPDYDDGIYELCVSKGERKYVVYIGAAHRDGPGSLKKRILEHCKGGSHKDELINKAINRGYKLLVRAQNITGDRDHVYECEDQYLAKYDYAWNKRKNGRIRKSVPYKKKRSDQAA